MDQVPPVPRKGQETLRRPPARGPPPAGAASTAKASEMAPRTDLWSAKDRSAGAIAAPALRTPLLYARCAGPARADARHVPKGFVHIGLQPHRRIDQGLSSLLRSRLAEDHCLNRNLPDVVPRSSLKSKLPAMPGPEPRPVVGSRSRESRIPLRCPGLSAIAFVTSANPAPILPYKPDAFRSGPGARDYWDGERNRPLPSHHEPRELMHYRTSVPPPSISWGNRFPSGSISTAR